MIQRTALRWRRISWGIIIRWSNKFGDVFQHNNIFISTCVNDFWYFYCFDFFGNFSSFFINQMSKFFTYIAIHVKKIRTITACKWLYFYRRWKRISFIFHITKSGNCFVTIKKDLVDRTAWNMSVCLLYYFPIKIHEDFLQWTVKNVFMETVIGIRI